MLAVLGEEVNKIAEARRRNREAQQRFRQRKREAAHAAEEQAHTMMAEIERLEDENEVLAARMDQLQRVLCVRDAMIAVFRPPAAPPCQADGGGGQDGGGARPEGAARPASPHPGAAAEHAESGAADAAPAPAAAALASQASVASGSAPPAAEPPAPPAPPAAEQPEQREGAPGGVERARRGPQAPAEQEAAAAGQVAADEGAACAPGSEQEGLVEGSDFDMEEVVRPEPVPLPSLPAPHDPDVLRIVGRIKTPEDYIRWIAISGYYVACQANVAAIPYPVNFIEVLTRTLRR
eukprot:scaffold10.g2289.t1